MTDIKINNHTIQIIPVNDKVYHYNIKDWLIDWDKNFITLRNFRTGNEIFFVMANVIKWQFVEVE